jgi:hypothetical protein
MLAYLGKNLTWTITSAIGLVVGISVLALNKTAWGSTPISGPVLPHLPITGPQHGLPPAVPEVNTGLVLLPIVLATLLFASRRLLRQRASENR